MDLMQKDAQGSISIAEDRYPDMGTETVQSLFDPQHDIHRLLSPCFVCVSTDQGGRPSGGRSAVRDSDRDEG